MEQQRGLLRGHGELGVAREVHVGLVEPAQLEQGARAPDVRVGGAGDPVVRLRQLDQLGRELQPVRRAAGPPAGLQGAGQRRRERLGPAHAARHRDRLVGDRPYLGLGDLREEAAVDRDPGEHLRAHRRVLRGQQVQRLLQQRDVLGVLDAVLLPGAAGVPERRAGEGLRGPGGAGGDRGAGEARARRLPLAGVRLGGGQRVLELGELGRVGVLVAAPQPDRAAQQPDRLVVGEPGVRLRGGAPGVGDGAVGRPRPGGAEVPRQLGQPGIRPRAVELLDRLADPPVQPRPPGRRQLGLERRAQQGVGERVAAGRARDLHEQRAAHGGVEDVEQLVLGEAGDALEQLEVEVAADQRGDAEHATGVLGQAADARRDHVAHALRARRRRRCARRRAPPGGARAA